MRVLLADDNRLLVEGLTNLLAAHGFEVVATASDGFEAIARTRVHRPDVVLMDVRMPHCDGLAATRLIKAESPETRVVMLTTSPDDADLFEAIRSGACGYLMKSVSGDQLVGSLLSMEDGIPPLSPGLAAKLVEEFARLASARDGSMSGAPRVRGGGATSPPSTGAGSPPGSAGAPPHLTDRQSEVLELVAAGRTYKEVGHELGLSERTVRYHMSEILARLHLDHRSQVLAYAGQAGLLDRHAREPDRREPAARAGGGRAG